MAGDARRLAADALRLARDALRLAEWLQSALAGDALRQAGYGDREGRRAVHAPSSCDLASPSRVRVDRSLPRHEDIALRGG